MKNTFEQLLEIKTNKKDLLTRATYVPNATTSGDWAYFIYFYDLFNHAFYINDLDNLCNKKRKSAISIIDNIINQAYKQEMNSFVPVLQKIQMNKKPKVFCIYLEKLSQEVVINKINLKVVRWLDWKIFAFNSPYNDKDSLDYKNLKIS